MLADELAKRVRGEVLTDKDTLATYSRDYSLFKVKPQIVVCPDSPRDVEELVKFVSEKKKAGKNVSITGRSAGTDMTGGPLNTSIIASFTPHLNRIRKITGAEAVVEPGVYFRDFEKELDKRGLLYPPYPASKHLCALGGMINNNSGGEKTLAYGKTENFVRSLRVVLADGEEHDIHPLSGEALEKKFAEQSFEGEVYRGVRDIIKKHKKTIDAAKPDVSKNSAGYAIWNVWQGKTFDLTKLIVGSQGTLGMLTEATVGLVRKKKHSRMAVVFLHDFRWVGELVNEALKFDPESIESYDDKTLTVALKFWRDVIKSMKGGAITLGLKFIPEAFMALRGGIPKMVVLVELTDDYPGRLAKRLEEFRSRIKEFAKTRPGVQVRVLRNEEESDKYWAIRRQSFALLHGHIPDKDTAPFIDDFVVKPKYLPEFFPKINAILEKYNKDLVYTIAGHPGNGNFHIIPLMDLKNPRIRALIPKISQEVYKVVFEYNGSTTGEHNDGLIRTPYLKDMFGEEMVEVFAEIKHLFDPLGIFNPGKKVGGTLAENLKAVSSSR
jgi:FAD/FMN-containing dehydrogenase